MLTFNGNINTQSHIGTYLYEPDVCPHALAGILENTAANPGLDGSDSDGLTGIVQDISYTAFNKVSCVQHHGSNDDRYDIRYGLDKQRIKTTYYTNGERQYDRYYFGLTWRKSATCAENTISL